MKTAIFLGAGASKAEGAPLQGDLFKEYFKHIRSKKPSYYTTNMQEELSNFFYFMFAIDVDHVDLDKIIFPIFEEVLGILDQAIIRNESLKDYDLENIASNDNRLRKVRLYVILSMAQIIHEKLQISKGYHEDLCKILTNQDLIKDIIFITTNYDILIDNALSVLLANPYEISLDYLVDFTNFNKINDWKKPKDPSVRLFKLHGSLNWLYCPTCNSLTLTPKEKGVTKLITDYSPGNDFLCDNCESVYSPLIIPPTFFKDMSNVFINTIWNKAEQELRNVEHIIFCGYSFPDADIHIKYLLKRIQTNRKTALRFTVINNHRNKGSLEKKNENERYIRFLGNNVNYTNLSFEQFANNPLKIIKKIKVKEK